MEFLISFQFAGLAIGLAAGAAVMGAVALGPVIGIVPVGAGFLAGRWAASRLMRSK